MTSPVDDDARVVRGIEMKAVATDAHATIPKAKASFISTPRTVRPQVLALAAAMIAVVVLCHTFPGSLEPRGRWTLAILFSAVLYWALSDISDVVTALLAVVALGLSGAVTESAILRTLGHEFIWLLVVAFAVGAVIRANQLVEWCFARTGMSRLELPALFAALTLFISATAFLIPSTSARAAILLPIFLMLAEHASPAQRKALGLLFPTVILLSAGASLIGAGAHAIAAQYLEQQTGRKIDVVSWAYLALPFAAATTSGAAATIYFAFVPKGERRSKITTDPVGISLSAVQRRTLMLVAATILGWVTTPWHGVGMVMIGLLGIAILLLPGVGSGVSSKTAFKAVEIELLVFLAATFVLADALVSTGAGHAIASAILAAFPQALTGNPLAMAVLLSAIGVSAHLLITSRTARVTVLMPTLVLPMISLGHSATTLVMVAVLSTGFCQTLPASAKPVGVFAGLSAAPFEKADLLKLSLLLMPQMLAALFVYALIYR